MARSPETRFPAAPDQPSARPALNVRSTIHYSAGAATLLASFANYLASDAEPLAQAANLLETTVFQGFFVAQKNP